MKNKNLKRLAALIFCAVLCLTAVACGKQESEKDGEISSAPEASAQETVEAGNAVESVHNETDAARTEESPAPQQTAATAKVTEKSTEKKTGKQTEKQTEKQTAAPKTEPQTSAKKKITQADLDQWNQGMSTDNSFKAKYSLRGNSLVLSIITDIRSDDWLTAYFNSSESVIENQAKKYYLKEYDIDSFIYEAVNKDGKTICSKEYK